MTRFKHLSAFVVVAVALAWPLEAATGVLIVEKTTIGGKTETHQLQIEKTRMRAEIGRGGQKQAVVFDGSKQLFWIINYDAKSYTEMTRADLDRMAQQMAGMMARMQEQMKSMPPEQRAQVEAMMRGRMGGIGAPAAPTPEYRRAGTDKVGKWSCNKYEGYLNNQKTSEVCTIDPKAVGVAAGDFDVSKQLGEFFKKISPQSAAQMFSFGSEDQGFSGIPVKRVTGQTVTEITDIGREDFPASTFELPEGFTREALGGGRGRGR